MTHRSWLFGALTRATKRFWYTKVPSGVQPEVLRALRRYRKLPEELRAHISFWEWLLGPWGTPWAKMDPADIEWTMHPVEGRQCNNCQRYYLHVVTNTGLCDRVAGVWLPTWWCDQWTEPISAEEYRRYQRGEALDRVIG